MYLTYIHFFCYKNFYMQKNLFIKLIYVQSLDYSTLCNQDFSTINVKALFTLL